MIGVHAKMSLGSLVANKFSLTDVELLAHAILGASSKAGGGFAEKHARVAENELIRRQQVKEELDSKKSVPPPEYL